MLDEDGYPTQEYLDSITDHDPWDFGGVAKKVLDAWCYDTATLEDATNPYGERVRRLHLITMGWSGNEELVGALSDVFRTLYFHSHVRGGHWVFEDYPRPTEESDG